MKLVLATLAALAASTALAQAQVPPPSLYGSLGYAQKTDSNLAAAQLRLGGRFGSYFGMEGEFSLGVEPDTDTYAFASLTQVKDQLRHEAGAYAVGFYPVTPRLDIFGRVGLGATSLKRTYATASGVSGGKINAQSVNYGVGAQYFLDGRNGLRVDYTRQDYNKRLQSDDTWSVAFTRRF